MTDRLATDILAELINQKHQVLEKMWQLSHQQTAAIDSYDMTQLMKLLSGKQKLLALLQTIEKKIEPFRDEEPDARIWRSTEDRQRCQQVAAECEQLLAQIVSVEKVSESDLMGKRNDTADRLQGVHYANTARQAYTQPQSPISNQLDLTSDS